MAFVVLLGATAQFADFPLQSSAAASQPSDSGAVRIEYRGQVGDIYYYVIENDITDDVGIYAQISISSSTTFKDERIIVQSIVPVLAAAPQTQPAASQSSSMPAPGNDGLLRFEWTVDRYKASESVTGLGGLEAVTFDSLKHTHPPKELSGLAKVPKAQASFNFDGETGAVSTILIKPGPGAHPTDSRVSKTAEKGIVSQENLQELLYAMGEQFLPNAPKSVGDEWVIKRVKPQPPYGVVTTNATCKLKSIERVGDSDIALIDISSVTFFEPSPPKPPPPQIVPPAPPVVPPAVTTRPTTTAPRYPIVPHSTRSISTSGPALGPNPTPTTRPTPHNTITPNANPATNPASPVAPSASMNGVGAIPTVIVPALLAIPQDPPASEDKPDPTLTPVATSRPMTPSSLPASHSPTQPAPNNPTSKPAEEPFRMRRAHLSGSVKFDITHGRLVELILRKNGAFVKVMRADKEEMEMKMEMGSTQTLRIKGSTTPPPQPLIPGGPKPPVEKPPPNARPATPTTSPASRPATPASTQAAMSGLARPVNANTTQPATFRGATTRPAMPTTRPASATSRVVSPRFTTSQPRPATQPATGRP